MIDHYSRTCGEPEEVITVEKHETLARVHVRLQSGRGLLQAGKSQALRYAKIVLVGMTTDTARSRPKACLLALFVSSMSASRALQAQRTGTRRGSPTSQTTHANWAPDAPRLPSQ
jgi:hypothetical protein